MSTQTVSFAVELEIHTCKSCGGIFALQPEYVSRCRELGGFRQMWACPYCKQTWGFGETPHEKQVKELQKKLDEQTRISQHERERAADLRRERDAEIQNSEHLKRSRNGLRGTLAKERKKISKGTCPCCDLYMSRTLEDHMKEVHPEYAKPKDEDDQHTETAAAA